MDRHGGATHPRGALLRVLSAILLLLTVGAGEAAAAITTPPAIRVSTVATGIGRPTNIVLGKAGSLWVTSAGYAPAASDGVWARLPGRRPRQVIRGLDTALGLRWLRGELYVSHRVRVRGRLAGRVTAYSRFDGRRFRRRRVVLPALPVGLHNLDSILAGPGGRLYLGVGSVGNARRGRSRLSAAVVSFLPSGRGLRVEARGLRNPYGLALIPGTRDLLITDNGRDDLGPRRPPEEVNLLRLGRRGPPPSFGFPACWGQGGRACRGQVPALARLPAHAVPGGVAVARRFGRYGLSAFVALNGSDYPGAPAGADVVRLALRRRGGGYRATVRPFARGFARHEPLGVALGRNGALYVTLYGSGRVLRFASD